MPTAKSTSSPASRAAAPLAVFFYADSRFRALESRTGKELWTEKIDASAHTIPVTYTGRNGKQYVVVEAFGDPGIVAMQGYFHDAAGDSIIAFALP